LVDRSSLWFRVFAARYGVEGGQLVDGGRNASSWWLVISNLRREEWFKDHVSCGVGNGKLTMFWSDVWVGGVALRERFSRLFDLSFLKEVSVFDMCQLGWGKGGEVWKWRRGLFAGEEEAVGDLCLLLHNVTLQVDKEDRWCWNLESSNDFTVRSAYKILTHHHNIDTTVSTKALMHKDIPLKVVLFAWRLLRDRLPTKDNLFRRGVIAANDRLCVGGCGSLESTPHLFLHCNVFGEVWHLIHRWLAVCSVLPNVPADYLNQFGFVGGNCSKVQHSILHLIWYATAWEIWKERNNRLFNGKECSTYQVVKKNKSLSYLWLKAKTPNFSFNYHAWWLSPFTMLGTG